MKKIMITLSVLAIGLSVHALAWEDFGYTPYQQTIPTAQTGTFSVVQPVNSPYSNMFYQDPNQVQCQAPDVNPYLYRRPYGVVNPYTGRVNTWAPGVYAPTTTGLYSPTVTTTTTGVPNQIVRNIGQSMLYSMMRRGY